MSAASSRIRCLDLARIATTLSTFAVFMGACFAPAIYRGDGVGGGCTTPPRVGTPNGAAALAFGWMGPEVVPWSANLLLLLAVALLGRRRDALAAAVGGAAACIALTTFLFFPAEHLLSGYWLWQGAMFLFACGTAVIAAARRSMEHKHEAAPTVDVQRLTEAREEGIRQSLAQLP